MALVMVTTGSGSTPWSWSGYGLGAVTHFTKGQLPDMVQYRLVIFLGGSLLGPNLMFLNHCDTELSGQKKK